MTDTAAAEAELAALVSARDALIRGESVSSATINGKTVQYRKADLGALNAAIAERRTALGHTTGRRRAMGIRFG